MAQDVASLVPRVRRAIEGPVDDGSLTDAQIVPLAADAIGDLILLSAGRWKHRLEVTARDADTNYPSAWAVDPDLYVEEESVVAFQAALNFIVHTVKDMKVMERIANEAQQWEWQKSPNVLRDWMAGLKSQRDAALDALAELNPVWPRLGSLIQARDPYGAALVEWYTRGGNPTGALLADPGIGGLGGGIEMDPGSWRSAP